MKHFAFTSVNILYSHKCKYILFHKVKVGRQGSCAQYGMLATEDIPEGYCLFQVPRTCVLMPENTEIADIFTKGL